MNDYLLRKGYVYVGDLKTCDTRDGNENLRYITTMLKNIESQGFTLSCDIIDTLNNSSKDDIILFYQKLITVIRNNLGYSFKMEKLLYKNFPNELMEKDYVSLYLEQLIHYISLGSILPESEKSNTFPLIHNKQLSVIKPLFDISTMVSDLLCSKVPLDDTDKKFIVDSVNIENLVDLSAILPKQDKMLKETLVFLINLLNTINISHEYKLKTATDVLRLVADKCGGDVSLVDNTFYMHLSRPYRRFIMDSLSECDNIEEDIRRHKQHWLRLGEYVKPFTYKDAKYEKVNAAFYKLRNDPSKLFSIGSYIDKAHIEGRVHDILQILSTRPGEFGRRLLSLIRNNSESDTLEIINAFDAVINQIETMTLLSIQTECTKLQANEDKLRIFMPKSNGSKIYCDADKRDKINEMYLALIKRNITTELYNRFSKLHRLGKVYIDPALSTINIPTAERNNTTKFKAFPRGSRTKIDTSTKILRLFVYWKDRSDIDLSALMFNENLEVSNFCSFRNRFSDYFHHSGDIINGAEGASEYIDIDLEKIQSSGCKYIVTAINSFSGIDFVEYEELFSGFMERQNNTGEVFEPLSVSHTSRLSGNSSWNVPVIFDVKNREIIWADVALNGFSGDSVDRADEKIRYVAYAMINMNKPSLNDLFALHAIARGEIVTNKFEADTIFSLDSGITPFDTELILSKFL